MTRGKTTPGWPRWRRIRNEPCVLVSICSVCSNGWVCWVDSSSKGPVYLFVLLQSVIVISTSLLATNGPISLPSNHSVAPMAALRTEPSWRCRMFIPWLPVCSSQTHLRGQGSKEGGREGRKETHGHDSWDWHPSKQDAQKRTGEKEIRLWSLDPGILDEEIRREDPQAWGLQGLAGV